MEEGLAESGRGGGDVWYYSVGNDWGVLNPPHTVSNT